MSDRAEVNPMSVIESRKGRRRRDRAELPELDRTTLVESERLRRRLLAQHERIRDEYLANRANR
jgi:hypothetical protein